jgi:hypothetical protein
MLQLARGEELDVKFGHSMHCLAELLRDVLCSADDSLPLSIPADHYGSSGEGKFQYQRKCRNWKALSSWAGARTSCMMTNKYGTLDMEHQYFENCSRSDGVLLPDMTKYIP